MAGTVYFKPLAPEHAALLAEQRVAIAEVKEGMAKKGLIAADIAPMAFVQEVIDRELITPDLYAYQESLGVLIGDEIIARESYRWMTVSTTGIPGPVVVHPVKAVVISPITAVLKRFAAGDLLFDVEGLIAMLIASAHHALRDPDTGTLDPTQPDGLAKTS